METNEEKLKNLFKNKDKPMFIKTKDGGEFVLMTKGVFEELNRRNAGENQEKTDFGTRIVKYLEPKDLPF